MYVRRMLAETMDDLVAGVVAIPSVIFFPGCCERLALVEIKSKNTVKLVNYAIYLFQILEPGENPEPQEEGEEEGEAEPQEPDKPLPEPNEPPIPKQFKGKT